MPADLTVEYPGLKIEFFDSKHYYLVNGNAVDGVTSVLDAVCGAPFGAASGFGQKQGIAGYRKLLELYPVPHLLEENIYPLLKQHKLTANDAGRQAGDRGTRVHKYIEEYIKTGDTTLPTPEDAPYINAFHAWHDATDVTFDASEVVVGSAEHGYAGTFDARAEVNGKTTILDFKTSSRIYDKYHAQLAAYELASQECGFAPSSEQAIVWLRDNGKYGYDVSTATADDWLSLLSAYRTQRRIAEARKAA